MDLAIDAPEATSDDQQDQDDDLDDDVADHSSPSSPHSTTFRTVGTRVDRKGSFSFDGVDTEV